MKILSIVGARPNFMKVAPLHRAFLASGRIDSKIVHTGQHYDARMSEVFFQQLELPQPDYYLGIGGGSHTQQTAKIMLAFEEVLEKEHPDLVLVVGDVNSTIAATLVATKMNVPVAHVEAGLRSGDRRMPEEINRLMTDAVSDYLFVTEYSGLVHLAKEGVPDHKVYFVGNCMIDSLVHYRVKAAATQTVQQLGLTPKKYVIVTMHRPSNVDTAEGLAAILDMLEGASQQTAVVFPVHPRTRQNFDRFGLGTTTGSHSQSAIAGTAGLPRIPAPDGTRSSRSDRFRWHSGRNHLFTSALPDFPRQYRKARHSGIGHQCVTR